MRFVKIFVLFSALSMIPIVQAQSGQDDASAQNQKASKKDKSTVDDVAGGVGSTAGGVAKGAGSAASGAAKSAGDLVTLHPVDAVGAAGKGAAGAGKDVTVGTAKGVGKVGKGIGHAFRKIF